MKEDYKIIFEDLKNLNLKSLTLKEVEKIKNLNINTLHDLLYYFPRAYDDRTNIKKIEDLRGDEYVVLKVQFLAVSTPYIPGRLKMTKARATDGTGVIDVVWFQMPYLAKSLKIGEDYILIGHIKRGYNFQMTNPEYKKVSNQIEMEKGEILPVYSTVKNFAQNSLRKVLKKNISANKKYFYENIPDEILKKYKIMERQKALNEIHFPSDHKNLEEAKRRFAIEELMILEMGILEKKFIEGVTEGKKYELSDNKFLVKNYLKNLNFTLTKAQKNVITDIYKELNNGIFINRLVQGDVGSGKTVVAMVLLLYIIENGYQGVIMAPTEILAAQHYLSIKDDFEKLGVRTELLTGSVKGKKKEALLQRIKNGEISLVIGTHALIEDNVEFEKLGLIVIDEQHRFGVVQRKKLRDKGILSNLLVMSATPIPRSLALSIYGDLDISIIDELPPGRKAIKTKWIGNEPDLEKAYNFIEKKLHEGRQAYFVVPLIEDSEKMAVKSIEQYKYEIENRFSGYKIGILHGKMKNSEKDEVMKSFKNKEIDILLSTTVVEVGINVPNATVISIINAERFGLSSLHQLRGRVGRGEHQSYCFLISKTDNDTSKARLRIMEKTQDGFEIAEEDLRLRKSGEIFGTRQTGFSDLKFIDITQDVKTIKAVKDMCTEYLKEKKGIIDNEYLKMDIEDKFKENL
ncbi:ATP-dependent DNA helicase RecG [Fusobacterium perfoetens]|uniref:ATP-dependent DNA helicase RecG n=1 Tax=Fusobacterium perfoetens TaxID=852 RepID=UPI001F2EF2DA|nr:ATP-dependent DNA helicase RecG [Fusobacterium perfoetens]MCF2624844.1 ATP-dependent DNA helicase RecG [Fusobacterium perfoetens]